MVPEINFKKCVRCLKCEKDCPSLSINIQAQSLNTDTFMGCGHCVAICPELSIQPGLSEIQKLNPDEVTPQNFQNLSANLRTCRNYEEKEPPAEILNSLIENMKHYPSASNARPVEIFIVRSKELIAKLNDNTVHKFIKTLSILTNPFLKPFLKLFAQGINLKGLSQYKKSSIARQVEGSSQVCHHAPMIMLFYAPKTKYGMADSDSYIWATYTSIYAKTLGLGKCFNGFIVKAMERSKTMRKESGIPDKHKVYAALLLGYPKVNYINETGRPTPKVKIVEA